MATVTPDLDLDLRTRLFIDGRFVDAAAGGRFTTENPATGQPLAEVAEGDAADVDAAVRGRARRPSSTARGRRWPRPSASASCSRSPTPSTPTPRSWR